MQILIYTDGACDIHADNRPGGWAAILQATDEEGAVVKENVISGGKENTTNNQMELTAVIEGLKLLTHPTKLTIVTDSLTVIRGAASRNGIVRSPSFSNEFVGVYESLWDEFFGIARGHQIEWEHVRGHSGHILNERCDQLAVAERMKLDRSVVNSAANSSSSPAIHIYLSTQYSGNAKAAAWVALIVEGETISELKGRLEDTTEPEAALIGAIASLDNVSANESAVLYTSQTYLADGMNKWIHGWPNKNWRTQTGKPVKYRRHWERLQQLTKGRQVQFRFVKARDGIPGFQRGKELTAEVLSRA